MIPQSSFSLYFLVKNRKNGAFWKNPDPDPPRKKKQLKWVRVDPVPDLDPTKCSESESETLNTDVIGHWRNKFLIFLMVQIFPPLIVRPFILKTMPKTNKSTYRRR